jgi:hypothetical protein
MKVYYTHCIPPTCFGHSCVHLQGGALQKIYISKYYRSQWNQCLDIKYKMLQKYVEYIYIECIEHRVVCRTANINTSLFGW